MTGISSPYCHRPLAKAYFSTVIPTSAPTSTTAPDLRQSECFPEKIRPIKKLSASKIKAVKTKSPRLARKWTAIKSAAPEKCGTYRKACEISHKKFKVKTLTNILTVFFPIPQSYQKKPSKATFDLSRFPQKNCLSGSFLRNEPIASSYETILFNQPKRLNPPWALSSRVPIS